MLSSYIQFILFLSPTNATPSGYFVVRALKNTKEHIHQVSVYTRS